MVVEPATGKVATEQSYIGEPVDGTKNDMHNCNFFDVDAEGKFSRSSSGWPARTRSGSSAFGERAPTRQAPRVDPTISAGGGALTRCSRAGRPAGGDSRSAAAHNRPTGPFGFSRVVFLSRREHGDADLPRRP